MFTAWAMAWAVLSLVTMIGPSRGATCTALLGLLVLAGCGDDAPPKKKPAICAGATQKPLDALYEQFASDIHPLLVRPESEGGCVACHNPANSYAITIYDDPAATLDALWSDERLTIDGDGSLLAVLADDAPIPMPQGGPRWSDDDRSTLRAFICDLSASGHEPPLLCAEDPDPGHAIIPRLTNDQYDRTVSDAMGDATGPGADFPEDVLEHGFDNNSTRQTFSPAHFEKYLDAGQKLAVETLLVPAPIGYAYEAETLSAFAYTGAPHPQPGWGGPAAEWYFFERMSAYVTTGLQTFPYDGTYRIRVRAQGKNADYIQNGQVVGVDLPVEMRVSVDGEQIALLPVAGPPGSYAFGDWQVFELEAEVLAGTHTVRVWNANTSYGAAVQFEVQLRIDWIEVTGPEPSDLPPVDQARIDRFLICDGDQPGCIDATIDHALSTLWRRPAQSEEIARYKSLIAEAQNQGDGFEDGLELVLEAALTSPHFLFRPEIDPDQSTPASHPLAPHELASRLSYFLWSSAPDAELLATAADGSLIADDGLAAQLDRMLSDARASALTDNFAAQWLGMRQMEYMTPSLDVFPEFDDALRDAMIGEVRALFQAFLDEDRNLLDIVDTDFTYVNARLADHYGLDGASSDAFVRVDVGDAPRGGLIESAGLLTLNAHPAKTSPTRRGKWLLDQLLCQPPADPPPDVNTNLEPPGPGVSIKEFLAQHRADPQCAGCHDAMDAMGLTLEHFDPLGRWRQHDDNDMPVDPTGELMSGQIIDGHQGLIAYLRDNPAFESCVARKMTMYALGRDPQHIDSCALDDIQASFAASGHTIRGLVKAIVMSPMFRQRRPELPNEYEEVSP